MRFDSSDKVTIRAETSNDLLAIRSVNKMAFGRDAEALLVDRLRDESMIFKSLVAVEAGRIVGNIVFSNLWVQTETGGIEALALAPVSVLPDFQGRQIGTRLVIEGLKLCKQGQSVLVLVVGNPKYYSRFGFSAN